MKRGKKYQDAVKAFDKKEQYDVADAIALVKKNATAKFDETIGGKPPQKLVTIFALFCRHINDCIISDREAAAFILALRALRDEIPA